MWLYIFFYNSDVLERTYSISRKNQDLNSVYTMIESLYLRNNSDESNSIDFREWRKITRIFSFICTSLLFFLSFKKKKKNLFLEFWFSIFVLFWLIDPTKLRFFYFFNLVLHSFLINLAKINFISIKMINSQADLPPLLKNLSIKFRFLLCLSSLLFLLINF